MNLRYLSVCSGIEAATIAWHPLGWTPVGFAEIDKFASAVLAHLFGSNLPDEPLARNGIPNHGDFTTIDVAMLGHVDVLVGGTPCQAFSFAGRRLSLGDARGNLTLAYAVLAHELTERNGLRNAVWENVPGVLSTEDNAFGCFLGALIGTDDPLPLPNGAERWPDAGMAAGPLARAAWRVLDAQYFGLAQRRERVFVVVDFGNGADPAAVLFEPQGMQGNSPPRREAGERVAGTVAARTQGGGGLGTDFDCDGGLVPAYALDLENLGDGGNIGYRPASEATITLNTNGNIGVAHAHTAACEIADTLTVGANQTTGFLGEVVAHTLRGEGFDASGDGTGRDIPLVPVVADTLTSSYAKTAAKAGKEVGLVNPIISRDGKWAVRRLTPVECARLQGFPDHHSRIPWRGKPAELCPDGPQYKTYGNSMAVKVMEWLGRRIAQALSFAAEAA